MSLSVGCLIWRPFWCRVTVPCSLAEGRGRLLLKSGFEIFQVKSLRCAPLARMPKAG
ncbi:hypothetical protein Ga0080574_TMP426 (plasmid) [Salipiger abyssi]|uniref:Uncharacterized protein n=1 Tax=Salipiger abyssi TaxID=1250539 RepID=A0A1P8UN10_9RHOB|nr:hypothetical protein Ga0080574_TMP426 [Salipiger abyssi]